MKFQPTEKAWMKSTLYGLEFKLVVIDELIEGESEEPVYQVDSGSFSKPKVPESNLYKKDAIEQVMRAYDSELKKIHEAKDRQFNLMREQLRS
jgi:hypothetical protein